MKRQKYGVVRAQMNVMRKSHKENGGGGSILGMDHAAAEECWLRALRAHKKVNFRLMDLCALEKWKCANNVAHLESPRCVSGECGPK